MSCILKLLKKKNKKQKTFQYQLLLNLCNLENHYTAVSHLNSICHVKMRLDHGIFCLILSTIHNQTESVPSGAVVKCMIPSLSVVIKKSAETSVSVYSKSFHNP